MELTINEVLQFTEQNDVKFIRLTFCDIFGTMKNISVRPTELERAFSDGVGFDPASVAGFEGESDLFLFPDPNTIKILPWRPQTGRVVRLFCDIKNADYTPYLRDGRYLLRRTIKALRMLDLDCTIGTNCQFYLFDVDEEGTPTVPHDNAGYYDIAPEDKCENIRRDISLNLEEMGISPISSHHDAGPGQNEIVFRESDIQSAVENFVTFKSVVKTIAQKNGMAADFSPKPLKAYPGNSLNLQFSLERSGAPLFFTSDTSTHKTAMYFMGGILNRLAEITAFLNTSTSSYLRLSSNETVRRIGYRFLDRNTTIRIPNTTSGVSLMELRSADPSISPYLAIALCLSAGIEGIQNRTLFTDETPSYLPTTINEALELTSSSTFVTSAIGQSLKDAFIESKKGEFTKAND